MDIEYHQTTLRFPTHLIAQLKAQASIERKSMTALIEDLCTLGLKVRAETNEDRIEEFRRRVRGAGSVV